MSRAEVHQLFDELDKDSSGHVSFDEFLQALRVQRVVFHREGNGVNMFCQSNVL